MISGAARPATDASLLSAQLELALVRELHQTWCEINTTYFKRSLHSPVLRLTLSAQVLGRYDGHHRSIEISLPLLLQAPWGVVVEVLKHEMAHQYVSEVLRIEETAHGSAFRDLCARMGIDSDATGLPTARPAPERSRLLKRVSDLLALAESPNFHEAKAAAAAAQRLMLRHNIESAAQRDRNGYHYRHLGRPSGRVPESDHILAGILTEHFFVEAIWVPAYRPEDGVRGSVLEICGRPENLEIASYVHAFLRGTAERLWADHRREQGLRSNRDRRTFVAGVMEGFRERLRGEKVRCRERGLVWLGDADLRRYHRQRHPHVRHVRYQGHEANEARASGRAAGRQIVLRRALDDRPHSRQSPRQLPPPRER